MTIAFGREICGTLDTAQSREWLVANGVGGYASGTVSGLLTRRYHGILVAALQPPLGRTLLVAKLDATTTYDGVEYPLYTNRWADGTVDPRGFEHIESFWLDGTVPVWRYACGDARLERRVWMERGENTTYITYELQRATAPLSLTIVALANYRDYHHLTAGNGWQMDVAPIDRGVRVTAYAEAVPFCVLSDVAEATAAQEWYRNFDLALETYRGLDHVEDHLHVATFRATLEPGQRLTIVASTESSPRLSGLEALERHRVHEGQLIALAEAQGEGTPSWIRQLVLAADAFIVDRPLPDDPNAKTVLAGYHWFGDWGRDTMISLAGLTLATGRTSAARDVLRTFARYVDRGMLPNRFPDSGETPEYNTVDATLWYYEAIRQYLAATDDDATLRELYPVLCEIIDWHRRGTRYNIHVDPGDGLLYSGGVGAQLTWMDAKVGDWVVTPRTGKAVEINALWYNALQSMAGFARRLDTPDGDYLALAQRVEEGFGRFWNERCGYCYDVIDGPDGDDASLRPNQLLAVSLPASPLTLTQQRGVVDACARRLLTSYGLRSLASDDPQYRGHYGGDPYQRDSAYHQGTAWSWLLGPFSLAHFRVYEDPAEALEFLEPMRQHLRAAGLGTISEIYDGDAPMTPRGCIAQAWGVAEVLRAWCQLVRASR